MKTEESHGKRLVHHTGICFPLPLIKSIVVAEAKLKVNKHSQSSSFTSDPDSKDSLGLAPIMGCGWRDNLSSWQYIRSNTTGKINTNLPGIFSQL